MKAFSESCRYDYPLTRDSIVFDVGAYAGTFAKSIVDRYGCRVLAFEPHPDFVFLLNQKFHEYRNVTVFPIAVGGGTGQSEFAFGGDSSGKYSLSERREKTWVMDIFELLKLYPKVDLLKLNIEGMEYDVIERIINTGAAVRIQNIQVQFHRNIPSFLERYERIRDALNQTHQLTYDLPFVWQNWELKA